MPLDKPNFLLAHPNETKGLMFLNSDPAVVADEVEHFAIGGEIWTRIMENGVYRAAWAIRDPLVDQTAAMNAVLAHAKVKELLVDTDVLINGTLSVPSGKLLHFVAGGKLTGNGNALQIPVKADMDADIFGPDLNVTLGKVGNSTGTISAKWFGVKGDGSDDAPELQRAMDIAVASQNYVKNLWIPGGNYTLNAPLIAYKWDGTRYQQVTVNIKGDAEYCGNGFTGTKLNFSSNNLFGIGIQQGKGVKVEGLILTGNFAPTFTSDFDFFSRSLAAYTDGVRRDTVHSPHCAIAIDPFGNNSNPSGKPWAGDEYPGYASWYRGPGGSVTQSGSTGVRITNCAMFNWVVGVGHSLNGETKNAEITRILDCQFGNVKVAIAGGQDQEKCNQAINIMLWYDVHTVFATGLYGHQIPGNWYVEKVNIAGRVQQLAYNNGQGYYASYYKDVFAERLGRIGYIGTKLSSRVSDCTFDIATPAEAGGYFDYVLEGHNTTFQNCIFRYYGPGYQIPIKGSHFFKGCFFDGPPYTYDPEHTVSPDTTIEQDGMSTFEDCMADSYRFGRQEDVINTQPTYMGRWIVYGKRTYRDISRHKQYNETVDSVIEGGSKVSEIYWARLFNDANLYTITYDANRTAIVNVGATWINKFRQNSIIVNQNNALVGICGNVNTTTNEVTIVFVSPDIVNGSQHTLGCVYPRVNWGSFIGDATSGQATITNVVFDTMSPDPSGCVGQLVELPIHMNYAFTGGYQRYAKIIGWNSGTKTITLDTTIPMTMTGQQFGLGRRYKNIYGATAITDLQNELILPIGSIAQLRPYLGGGLETPEYTYMVTKTGFADAAAMGGGETRQAQWHLIGSGGNGSLEGTL